MCIKKLLSRKHYRFSILAWGHRLQKPSNPLWFELSIFHAVTTVSSVLFAELFSLHNFLLGINSLCFFFFPIFQLWLKTKASGAQTSLLPPAMSIFLCHASFRLWARHFPHNLSLPEDLSLGAPSNGLFLSSWKANCSISKNRKHVSKVDLRLVLWPQPKLGMLSMLRMFHPLTQC